MTDADDELELLLCMFPDELTVEGESSERCVRIDIRPREDCDRGDSVFVGARLCVALGGGYPEHAPTLTLEGVRGLDAAAEADLLSKLREEADSAVPDGCLFQLVELARDELSRRNRVSCAICLSPIEGAGLVRTPCNHAFDSSCLAYWWKQFQARKAEHGAAIAPGASPEEVATAAAGEARVVAAREALVDVRQKQAAKEERVQVVTAHLLSLDEAERMRRLRDSAAADELARQKAALEALAERERQLLAELAAAAPAAEEIDCPVCRSTVRIGDLPTAAQRRITGRKVRLPRAYAAEAKGSAVDSTPQLDAAEMAALRERQEQHARLLATQMKRGGLTAGQGVKSLLEEVLPDLVATVAAGGGDKEEEKEVEVEATTKKKKTAKRRRRKK
eukprot:PLAT12629.1.p1 GENE.PLAT12629.1~~PLAT12629.1.p1  ORF type:complete len:392 (+),score=198.04 PLAT12629.1:18-1193(+)